LITSEAERFTQRAIDVMRCNQAERSLVQVPYATSMVAQTFETVKGLKPLKQGVSSHR